MKRKTPEGYVLDAVLQYLAVKKIFHMRMNSGAIRLESQGRTRYFKGHDAGTADVLAFPSTQIDSYSGLFFIPHWIECKADKGRQSELQKAFQEKVEAEGHAYVLCYGIEDLERAGL